MNNNEQFVEGVKIISKYIEGKDDWAVQASHDLIWFGGEDWVTDEVDVEKLIELSWFVDEDSWCFTT